LRKAGLSEVAKTDEKVTLTSGRRSGMLLWILIAFDADPGSDGRTGLCEVVKTGIAVNEEVEPRRP